VRSTGSLSLYAWSVVAAVAFPSHDSKGAEQEPTPQAQRLSVTHPRPVGRAVHQFAEEYGYVITYEEPRWLYDGDLVDVTDKVRRTPWKPGDLRIFSPKSGTITVEYPLSAEGWPTDVRRVIDDVLRLDAERIGERFKVLQDGEDFHVVPIRTRDATGQWVAVTPILDTRISIPVTRHYIGDYFLEICRELSKQTSQPIEAGSWPLKLFLGSTTDGADDEIARDVVMRLLRRFQQKLSWYLAYDASMKRYYFSVVSMGYRIGEVPPWTSLVPSSPNNRSPMESRPANAMPGVRTTP